MPINTSALRSALGSLRRLLRLLRGQTGRYRLGLLLLIPQNLLFDIVTSVSLILLLRAAERSDRILFLHGILFTAVGSAVLLVVVALGGYVFTSAVERAGGALRKLLFDRLQRMPLSWFESGHSGDALSRLTNDMQAAQQAWGWQLVRPAMAMVSGLGSGVVMFLLDWRAALLCIGLGLLGLWIDSRFVGPLKRESDGVQRALGGAVERLSDTLAAAQVIRIFNLKQWVMARFEAAAGRIFTHDLRRARWSGGQAGVNAFVLSLSFVGLLLIGSVFVIRGWMAFSTLVGIIQLSNGIIVMFSGLGNMLTALQSSLAGADRLFELLDAPAEDTASGRPLGEEITGGALRVRDLRFAYEPDHPVLRGVDFTIHPGETVAIVGGSGSGKSTLLKLLMGFYPAGGGDILLWGQPIGELSLEAVRSQIAYVPQANYLFTGTVSENIGCGRPGASAGEIEAAARAALAHDFIEALPGGYGTPVGERGAQLSGGQRQRIAIARALLKDAPILLLDEATASLDSQSERLVQQALARLMAGRTVIVVAHRLSTVRNASYILVLEDGRIAERGSHRELLRARGRYAYYYRIQFAGREKAAAPDGQPAAVLPP